MMTVAVWKDMVTWTKPHICDGYVDLETVKILFEEKSYKVNVEESSYNKNEDGGKVTVYLIDFEAKETQRREFSFEIVVK